MIKWLQAFSEEWEWVFVWFSVCVHLWVSMSGIHTPTLQVYTSYKRWIHLMVLVCNAFNIKMNLVVLNWTLFFWLIFKHIVWCRLKEKAGFFIIPGGNAHTTGKKMRKYFLLDWINSMKIKYYELSIPHYFLYQFIPINNNFSLLYSSSSFFSNILINNHTHTHTQQLTTCT